MWEPRPQGAQQGRDELWDPTSQGLGLRSGPAQRGDCASWTELQDSPEKLRLLQADGTGEMKGRKL